MVNPLMAGADGFLGGTPDQLGDFAQQKMVSQRKSTLR